MIEHEKKQVPIHLDFYTAIQIQLKELYEKQQEMQEHVNLMRTEIGKKIQSGD